MRLMLHANPLPTHTRSATTRFLGRLALFGLGAGLLAFAMYQLRTPQQLSFGAQDSFFLQGFQTSPQDALNSFRWTNGDGRVTLRDLGSARPLQISIRLDGMRAQGSIPVQFLVNGEPVARFENSGWETYSFLVSDDVMLAPDRLRIWIQSDTFSPADQDPSSKDTRDLGVAVAWVRVQPLWDCTASRCDWLSLVTVPPLLPILESILLAAGVYLLSTALGMSSNRTEWLTTGIVLLVGAGLGFGRILTTQYLPSLTVGIGALAIAAGIIRYAYRERQRQGFGFSFGEILALVIFLLIVFVHLNRLSIAFADPGEDGQVYFSGAKHLVSGDPLYDLAAMRDNLFAPVYKIPPFYAMLQLPYRSFGAANFIFGFRVVNEALYLINLFLLARSFRIPLISVAGFGLFAIGLLMDPAMDTLRQAQSGLLILFFLTLSLAFLQRGQQGWGGFFLAVPFMIKLYPAFLLLPLLVLHKRRALVFFAITVIVLFGAGIAVAGWDQNWIYLTQVLPLTQGSTAWPENASVFGFLSRFFTDDWGTNDFATPALRIVYYTAAAAFTLTTLFVFMRYITRGERFNLDNWRGGLARTALARTDGAVSTMQWAYALFALTLLIVSPLTWNHYLPTVMLAIPTLLVSWQQRAPRFLILFLGAIGIVLVAYGIYPIPLQELNFGAWKQLVVSYRFYGVVLLWVAMLYALWGEAKREQHGQEAARPEVTHARVQ